MNREDKVLGHLVKGLDRVADELENVDIPLRQSINRLLFMSNCIRAYINDQNKMKDLTEKG